MTPRLADPVLGGPERLAALRLLEETHELFSFTVDGWSAWRVMRNAVNRSVADLPLSSTSRFPAGRLFRALFQTANLVRTLLFSGRVDLLVKTARSGLRVREGKQYKDVYFDGILPRYSSHFKLEENNAAGFDKQSKAAAYPSHLDPIAFTFLGKILGTIFPAPDSGFAKRASKLILGSTGVHLSDATLLMRISTVYWQSRLYSVLLKKLNPSAILVADTGEYSLVIAAHRLNIPVIELQHGVFDRAHPDAIPNTAMGDARQLVLPSRLALRGTYWAARLAGTKQHDRAKAVGNEAIDLAREHRVSRKSQGPSRRKLVLTSQGMDSKRLAAWIDRLVESAPKDLDWSLSIKKHPAYDDVNPEFDRLEGLPCVSVIQGSASPSLFELLADADLHLSISSASHFDALALGIPSIVIPLAGHEDVIAAVADGHLALAATPEDVWGLDVASLSPGRAALYSEPHFVRNMQYLLAEFQIEPVNA